MKLLIVKIIVFSFFIINSAQGLSQYELPFGAYDLRGYDSLEVSKLADSLCFNIWVEYQHKLQPDSILLMTQKGIQAIRGGLILPTDSTPWDAEAPFKYSWSYYGEVEVAYPYPNPEVRMVAFGGYYGPNGDNWISPRSSPPLHDRLSGISTFLSGFDEPKSHIVFNSNYYFGFPRQGRIPFTVEVIMKIDSIANPADTVAILSRGLGGYSSYWQQYACSLDVDPIKYITAGDFSAAGVFDTIVGNFIFPNIVTFYVDGGGGCIIPICDTFSANDCYGMDLNLEVMTTGKREVTIDKINIYDLYGFRLIRDSLYDLPIITQFQAYNTPQLRDAIYGWMLMDEPHWANLKPFNYIRSLTRQVNPNWHIWTFFDKYWALQKSYLTITGEDAVTNDIYPFGETTSYAGNYYQSSGPLNTYNSCLWAANFNADTLGDFWVTPQAYRSTGWIRYPTPSEFSCETFMALCWGAKGIIYYKYDTSNPIDYDEYGIRNNGTPTNLYEAIRDRIGPYIRAVDATYMGLTVRLQMNLDTLHFKLRDAFSISKHF
jgi:hypothetical protein